MIQTENEGSPSMDKEKIQFMACLNLVSPHAVKDILQEMQTRKSERKRKSTANPQFCYFEPEMDRQEENCAICHRSGELIICDECSLTYHLQCLSPPLTSVPSTFWLCPKCQVNNKKINDWPSNLALIHSYVMLKTAKEEEKKRLKKTIEELVEGKQALERETIKLKELLVLKLHEKCRLLENCNSAQRLLDAIQKFVLLVQS